MKNRGKVPTITDLRKQCAKLLGWTPDVAIGGFGGEYFIRSPLVSIGPVDSRAKAKRALGAALRELGKDIK